MQQLNHDKAQVCERIQLSRWFSGRYEIIGEISVLIGVGVFNTDVRQ